MCQHRFSVKDTVVLHLDILWDKLDGFEVVGWGSCICKRFRLKRATSCVGFVCKEKIYILSVCIISSLWVSVLVGLCVD